MSVASEMCSMSAFAPRAYWSVITRRRVIASKVTSPTNARRRPRHDRGDVVAALLQLARDFDGLVGADAAGDAERDQGHGYSAGLDRLLRRPCLPSLPSARAARASRCRSSAACSRAAAAGRGRRQRSRTRTRLVRLSGEPLSVLSRNDSTICSAFAAHRPQPRPLGQHDRAQPLDARLELVVHDHVVVLDERGDSARAVASRRCMAASLSLLRPRSRCSSTS